MSENFPEELSRLEMVKKKLYDELKRIDQSVAQYEKEYKDARRYLTANWNEIDSMERFSNERSLLQIENSGAISLEKRARVQKLISSPYFARIDFQYQGEQDAEEFYIGSFSFTDDKNRILIYDWRAPVSSMYYDYELGEASYEAPVGTLYGAITRKRQFKIKDGQMEYVLESAINIDDDILQRELSSTSDEKMKTIIATIQKEQNQIIRNDKADILVIQGVAGSGKTSIALHRVAYLLYRYKDQITADRVVIISPNKVFADYISNVLPELGEEPILELSFEDIAASELSGILEYERFTDRMESMDLEWIERSRFKSNTEFISLADNYLAYVDDAYFEPQECSFQDFIISQEYIQARYHAYRNRPIWERFSEMAGDILERMKTENIREAKLPGRNDILKKISSMFKVKTTLELYQDFFCHINKQNMLVFPDKNKLEWPDVFPYLYFKAYLEGIEAYPMIQHLVIDEMQDYTPIQYAVVNKIYPCKKTILGDFGQAVNPYNSHSISGFKRIFPNVDYVELNKSYRSTYEIIEFAKRIQNSQCIEPVKRHGEEVGLIHCASRQEELTALRENIKQFLNSSLSSLGILCKNTHAAKSLYDELSDEYPVFLLDFDSDKFENGITITTIFMSKGLEFDEVIIPFADNETYALEYDRGLLYVACTRAMHKLTLSYAGDKSEFLKMGG